MFEWNEQHKMVQQMVRRFVDAEVVPNLEALEFGDLPPYGIMRKLVQTFGIADMQKGRFERQKKRWEEAEAAKARGEEPKVREKRPVSEEDAEQAILQAI